MNRDLWVYLLFEVWQLDFESENDIIIFKSYLKNEYPALDYLQHLSHIEIVVFAYLILHLEGDEPWENKPVQFENIFELLARFDYTHDNTLKALNFLNNNNLIELCVEDAEFGYKANKQEIILKKLYMPKWSISPQELELLTLN